MNKNTTILVAEDEQGIADNILFALKQESYNTIHVQHGTDVFDVLSDNAIDLILLDVGLPDISGFDVCKSIRKTSDVPIIFLTARSDEIDRVVGLEIGANDYVTKPFSPRELLARIKLRLKDQKPQSPNANSTSDADPIFIIDDEKKKVSFCGEALNLTVFEYGILTELLGQPERVFSREQLIASVRDLPEVVLERAIDNHIKTLRAKLKAINEDISPIVTHRGMGYSIHL